VVGQGELHEFDESRVMSLPYAREGRSPARRLDRERASEAEAAAVPGSALWELKNRRVSLLVLVMFVGTGFSLLFHWVAGSLVPLDHVSSTFLLSVGSIKSSLDAPFADAASPLRDARASVGGTPWRSPTPLFHVLYVMVLPLGTTGAIVVQALTFIVALSVLLWRAFVDTVTPLGKRVVFFLVLLVFSYPVLFVLERGNVEMLLFVAIVGFFYLYYVKRSVWCVVFLALAISLKMYPAVFLVLLIADKRYKWVLFTVFGAAVVTMGSILSMALFLPGSLVDFVRTSVSAFKAINTAYVEYFWGLPYGHSLWGVVIFVTRLVGVDPRTFVYHAILPYTIAVFCVFIALSVFVVRVVKLPWQRVALLTVAALALPTVSADYRLLYAYVPLAMLLNARVRTRVDAVCVVLLGCLLVPMDYVYGVVLYLHEQWPGVHSSISVVIYPLILCTLVAVIVWNAWTTRGDQRAYTEIR
jgi:hypothetical protein